MRRLVAAALMVVAAAGAAALVLGSRAEGASDYRVDVIFDSARGVIPGQLVKVAGAPVGSIKDVKVTPGYRGADRARGRPPVRPVQGRRALQHPARGPDRRVLRAVRPGHGGRPPAARRGGQAADGPRARTTLPVGLMDLFELANVPVRDRARVLINELGIGLIARGEDLNAILRRTNPALQQARRGITLLNRQRADLDRIVRSTDRVAASLARRRGRVRDFIRGAARVTEVTGSRNAQLSEGVRRLPALLRATRPALRAVDRFSADAEPLLDEVRAAAPGVATSLRELRTFAGTSAEPLRGLRSTLVRGRRAAIKAKPFTGRLDRFLADAPTTIGLVADLFGDLEKRGFTANLLELFYYGAAMSARYDEYGHILPSRLLDLPTCGVYATTPVAGCEARPGNATARATKARKRKRPARRRRAGQARARAAGALRPARPGAAGPRRRRSDAAPLRCRCAADATTEQLPTTSRTSSSTCSSETRSHSHGAPRHDPRVDHDRRRVGRRVRGLQRQRGAAVRAHLRRVGGGARRRPAREGRRRAHRRGARGPGPGGHGGRAARRAAGARLALALNPALQPLAADSRAQVRPVSILGGKYLALEEGRSRRGIDPGGTLRVCARPADGRPRRGAADIRRGDAPRAGHRRERSGRGGGRPRRGAQPHAAVHPHPAAAPRAGGAHAGGARHQPPRLHPGRRPGDRGARARGRAARRARRRRRHHARGPERGGRAARAGDRELPATEQAGTVALRRLTPVLVDAAALARELRPAAGRLPGTSTRLSRSLVSGTAALRARPRGKLDPLVRAFSDVSENPASDGAIRKTHESFADLEPVLTKITAAQLHCNVFGIWAKNVGSIASQGTPPGPGSRCCRSTGCSR